MASRAHHIYLIPGFFGFTQLGNVKYFAHVRDLLEPAFESRGLEVAVHYVPTLPTAALHLRAGRLLEVIDRTSDNGGPIHLIGHSSGGLDARLLAAPGSHVGDPRRVEPIAARIESVVGIGTPHHGTPLAAFFNSVAGRRVLRLLSLASAVVLRRGRLPLALATQMLGLIRRADNLATLERTVLDQFYEQLLSDFSADRRAELRRFFDEAYRDQSLLAQLTPEGMANLNARLEPREGVSYGDVVLRARPPQRLDALEVGFDAYAQTLHRIYKWLHRLTSGGRRPSDIRLAPESAQTLAGIYGDLPAPAASDGIVPTRSQVMSRIVHATWSDHLDAIGHFDDPHHDPPHFDWLPSASRFRRHHFEALWSDIVDFMLSAS